MTSPAQFTQYAAVCECGWQELAEGYGPMHNAVTRHTNEHGKGHDVTIHRLDERGAIVGN